MMYGLGNILIFEKERNNEAWQCLLIEEVLSENLPVFKFVINHNKID
jgi:hypothetical protein